MSFITALVKGGAGVKAAQELARHSTPTLTLGVYSKLGVHDLAGALDVLPTLTADPPARAELRATGTDDATADVRDSYAHLHPHHQQCFSQLSGANRCDDADAKPSDFRKFRKAPVDDRQAAAGGWQRTKDPASGPKNAVLTGKSERGGFEPPVPV